MQNSKCLHFFKALTPVELKRFEKYLLSPYFNMHEDTKRFFFELKQYYPDFEADKVEKTRLYQQLYPGRPFDESKLYTLSKYLLRLLEDFLIQEEIQHHHALFKQRIYLQVLRERKLYKFIPRALKQSFKELDEFPLRNAYYYQEQLHLRELENWYGMQQNNRSTTVNYHWPMESLDQFYLIQKPTFACGIIDKQQSLASEGEIHFLEPIIEFCASHELAQIPVIQIYYLYLMTLKFPEEQAYFFKLKDMVQEHGHLMPRDEQTNIFALMINYCTRRYRRGEMQFLQEMFLLYQHMLANDLVFQDPMTSNLYYKNLVTLGILLKEYDWTEEFIHTYKHQLDKTYREGVVSYNLANMNFARGNYSKAMRLLQKVEFLDPYYRMNYHILLMKTYYECDEIEPLYSLFNTFSTYILRNKAFSDSVRMAYKNLVRFLRKMSKIKDGNLRRFPKFEQELNACELLAERKWIVEKAAELKADYQRRYSSILD